MDLVPQRILENGKTLQDFATEHSNNRRNKISSGKKNGGG
jgi:hypothetical protein